VHVCVRVCVCVCVCVSVAILAQGTNFMLFFDGIEVSMSGCDPVIAVGYYSLYLFARYLCKLLITQGTLRQPRVVCNLSWAQDCPLRCCHVNQRTEEQLSFARGCNA
jgi:hypothetical protein